MTAALAVLRWVVAVLAVLGILLCVLGLTSTTRAPRLGTETPGGLSAQQLARVTTVLPGSAAERAGIRPGDRIRFASPADARASAAHLRTTVHLERADGSIIAVELAPAPRPLVRTMLIVQSLLMSLLVLLLAFRAWHDIQARRLAVGFVWIAWRFGDANVSGWVFVAIAALSDVLTAVGMVALVFFATGWSATPPVAVRLLRRAAVAIGILYFAANEPGDFGFRIGSVLGIIQQMSWPALALLMIGGLVASTRGTRGVERRRIGWILATMTISFVPFVLYEALFALGAVGGLWTWASFTALVLPFGFGYAMLRHRVIDLGFALNRAAVFAATTALLVGLFGALQWGADQLLVRATGAQNFAVQMAIAVVVLYVLRSVRAQTDTVVARVFFAQRRRRIDAIVALGRAVEAVESAAALGPYVVEQLQAGAAIESALYVETEDAYVRIAGGLGPERVGRDNSTVIALRATGAAVPIRAESDLIGAIAFPLSVRGKLRGALVCALPSQDEEFAPDEQAALHGLAACVCDSRRPAGRAIAARTRRAARRARPVDRGKRRCARSCNRARCGGVKRTMVMERAPQNPDRATTLLRARTGGPTQRVGGAQPGAERL